MGCGEVRDLCFGVLFVDQGTYFIAFVCMVVYFGYGMAEASVSKPRKNIFRRNAPKKLLP